MGVERHDTVDLALRYLGLGAPTAVPADAQGRLEPEALAAALAVVPPGEPMIVCLQAGNLHSGAFDPFPQAIAMAHDAGAWVHVDGAFGLWAAASPRLGGLTQGIEMADSWATDAHKTLNALSASEAAAVTIEDYADTMRGHRVLHLVGKGNKPATMPITVPVLRVLEACRGHISPHSLRHAAITYALDVAAHDDETKATPTLVLRNAVAWFAIRGVTVRRALSENGGAYRFYLGRDTYPELGITTP